MALQIPPNCDLTLGLDVSGKVDAADARVWRVRVDERFLNPAGVVQGGFLAAMLDSAMGASAVTERGERRVDVANTEMKVVVPSRGSRGDVLTCTASVLKPGRVISFSRRRSSTKPRAILVATASSTYLIKRPF